MKPTLEIIKKRPINRVFLGAEPSGPAHLGHYLTLKKLKSFAEKGFKTYYLIADLHALLNKKTIITEKYKEFILKFSPKTEVLIGSESYDKEYYLNLIKATQNVTYSEVLRGSGLDMKKEVQKNEELKRGNQMRFCYYPLFQAYDSFYFNCDTVLAGIDQRNIYMLGYELAEKNKFEKPNLYFYPLITKEAKIGGFESKISSSDSKNSLFLDKNLYKALDNYFSAKSLSEPELELLKFLKKFQDKEVLELYETSSNEQFLSELHKDLYPLRDFSFHES